MLGSASLNVSNIMLLGNTCSYVCLVRNDVFVVCPGVSPGAMSLDGPGGVRRPPPPPPSPRVLEPCAPHRLAATATPTLNPGTLSTSLKGITSNFCFSIFSLSWKIFQVKSLLVLSFVWWAVCLCVCSVSDCWSGYRACSCRRATGRAAARAAGRRRRAWGRAAATGNGRRRAWCWRRGSRA